MSSSLFWEPLHRDTKETLPFALKQALQKKFGAPIHCVVNKLNNDYLEGLRDAGVEGAARLLNLIEKYEVIKLDEEF